MSGESGLNIGVDFSHMQHTAADSPCETRSHLGT